MLGHERGFTLIEVLIASVIMFTVLSIGVSTYRTSLHLLDKTTKYTLISRALPAIMEEIKQQILNGESQGEGFFSRAIAYGWSSSPQQQGKNFLAASDVNTGTLQPGMFTVVLYDVNLNIKYRGKESDTELSYSYNEFMWSLQ